jgi:hypothetical protein
LTCGGWTSGSATAKADNAILDRGDVLSALGGITSSVITATDGGCETARPIACCDGFPPQ